MLNKEKLEIIKKLLPPDLQDTDIEKEYDLIKQKKSNLSFSRRKMIIDVMEK